ARNDAHPPIKSTGIEGWAKNNIKTLKELKSFIDEEVKFLSLSFNFFCIFYSDPERPCYSWRIGDDSLVRVLYKVEHEYLRKETHGGVEKECYGGKKIYLTADVRTTTTSTERPSTTLRARGISGMQ
ncbi:MAG: hypothetical protein QXH17_08130, partial [Candidatus Bathyarchaeia archaeon]